MVHYVVLPPCLNMRNLNFPGFDIPGFDILDLEYQGGPRETRGNTEGSLRSPEEG